MPHSATCATEVQIFWPLSRQPPSTFSAFICRDAMMAANLRAVAERGPALVFAHNLHLQRNTGIVIPTNEETS
ncbi:erythromycin esterase family protein, partial [Streptosporangium sp. NPDC001682]